MNHPLNFLAVGHIAPINGDPSRFKSKTCRDALLAFKANTDRAFSLGTLPGFAFLLGANWTAACTNASYGTIGRNASHAQKQRHASKLHGRSMANMLKLMQQSPLPARDELKATTKMFEVFNQMCGAYQHATAENVLRGIIVDSWTTIEVLSEGLYMGAHKETPRSFPVLSNTQQKRIGFRSRERIRASFAISFPNDPGISNAFQDKAMDTLALLRNIIVHKGAVADQEFMDGAAMVDNDPAHQPRLAPFKNLKKGDSVMIDGETVRSVVDSAFRCGYACISAVDSWISANRLP